MARVQLTSCSSELARSVSSPFVMEPRDHPSLLLCPLSLPNHLALETSATGRYYDTLSFSPVHFRPPGGTLYRTKVEAPAGDLARFHDAVVAGSMDRRLRESALADAHGH